MKVQKEVSSYFESLKKRGDTVKGIDHGAGQSVQSKVGAVARKSATQSFESNLLGRLALYHSSKRILELGGNLGKASAVIASMNKDAEIASVEGNEGLTRLAQEGFDALGIQNIKVVHSTFDSFFDSNESKFDFVFIDGDHSYEPTMRYYDKAKNVLTGVGPIVLHDIYWSKGMIKAWNEIKQDPDATITIDLFFVGLVYFREGQQKEHFRIRFPRSLFGLFL